MVAGVRWPGAATGRPQHDRQADHQLSDTARIVLTRAAEHPERLVSFHKKLPAGARAQGGREPAQAGPARRNRRRLPRRARSPSRTTACCSPRSASPTPASAPSARAAARRHTAPAASADAVAQEAAAVADALDAAPVAPARGQRARHPAPRRPGTARCLGDIPTGRGDDHRRHGSPAIARLDAALATPAPRTTRRPAGTAPGHQAGAGARHAAPRRGRQRAADRRGNRLEQQHGPRLPGGPEEEGLHHRDPGSGEDGRPEQGRREGVLHGLPDPG